MRSIELARTILVDSFSAFSDNDVHLEPTLDPLFMKNPFFCDGDEWKRMRSQVGMIFSANKVRQVVPLVAEVCDKLVAYIDDRLTVEHEAKKVYIMVAKPPPLEQPLEQMCTIYDAYYVPAQKTPTRSTLSLPLNRWHPVDSALRRKLSPIPNRNLWRNR